MQVRSLFELEGLPISEGATSPAPTWGFPVAYSTTLNTYVFWKAGAWTAALQPPGSGSGETLASVRKTSTLRI